MNKKIIAVIALVLVLTVGLVACNGKTYKASGVADGGVPKKPQNAKIAATTPREVDTVKSPFSAAAYREFMEKHKALSAKIDSGKNSEKH